MYLFFDTETTGLPNNWQAPVSDLSNWPRLVQIAWIRFDAEGREINRHNHIVKPDGYVIPVSATTVHGISHQQAVLEGVALDLVLDEFTAEAKQARVLVAHNIAFDEKVMGAELLRRHRENIMPATEQRCTMKDLTDYVAIEGKYGYKWPTLAELHHKLFGHGFQEAHNAAADIQATAKCFWEARRRGLL